MLRRFVATVLPRLPTRACRCGSCAGSAYPRCLARSRCRGPRPRGRKRTRSCARRHSREPPTAGSRPQRAHVRMSSLAPQTTAPVLLVDAGQPSRPARGGRDCAIASGERVPDSTHVGRVHRAAAGAEGLPSTLQPRRTAAVTCGTRDRAFAIGLEGWRICSTATAAEPASCLQVRYRSFFFLRCCQALFTYPGRVRFIRRGTIC